MALKILSNSVIVDSDGDNVMRDYVQVRQWLVAGDIALNVSEHEPAVTNIEGDGQPREEDKAKSSRFEGAAATESVLSRVWDRPEEDEACRDL